MQPKIPDILALDFDGVICDGLIEYFQTAWRTYCQIWSPEDRRLPEAIAPSFYRLRPVIETGWEMPILIRAQLQGTTEPEILENWQAIARRIVDREDLNPLEIAAKLDRVRDEWIASDLEDWLSLHRFYPGVAQRLQAVSNSSVRIVIITTKEGRFVRSLLQRAGIQLSDRAIYGKESKRPKHEILREFVTAGTEPSAIWFVEDRLKTLETVKQHHDLDPVRLYLAEWGYNTQKERDRCRDDGRIRLLPLAQFGRSLSEWR
jgi:phosphoglycolate phosphatase-like HAD superfamily hydrolase